MYLISQIWLILLGAFLLGALAGYTVWRLCVRPMIDGRLARTKTDFDARLGLLQTERADIATAKSAAEAESERLRADMTSLKLTSDETYRSLTVSRDAEAKLKADIEAASQRLAARESELAKAAADAASAHTVELQKTQDAAKAYDAKIASLTQANDIARKEAEDAKIRHAAELSKAREQLTADWTAKQAAEVKRVRDEANVAQTAELAKLRTQLATEWTAKEAAEVKKARDDVTASLTTAHTAEIRKLQDSAKAHETKVLALTQSGDTSRKEMDEAKARHASELTKAREQVAAEWTAKQADAVKAARQAATAEAARKMADEVKHASEQVTAEWTAREAAANKKVRNDAAAAHTAELARLRTQLTTEWTAREAAAVKAARDGAIAGHTGELQKARDQVADEWTAKQAAAVKAARDEAAAEADRRHAQATARLRAEHDAIAARHTGELATARASALAAVPAAAVAKPQAAVAVPSGAHDDLRLIWGVGPEIEKLLNAQGITRFAQIAAWTDSDLAKFESQLPAFKDRPVKEKWIEQCQKLATGWRPEREIGDKPAGEPGGRLTAPRGGKADDLSLIWGVGPKLEELLNSAGFHHFDQIANWTDKDLAWVDSQIGAFAGRPVRDKWIDQCKKLATGWRPTNIVGDKPE